MSPKFLSLTCHFILFYRRTLEKAANSQEMAYFYYVYLKKCGQNLDAGADFVVFVGYF